MCCQLARWEAQWKGIVELERRCQDTSREIQTLIKRHEILKNAIEGKLRVQSRASERLQDQIIEEIKEMEHTKTEEALQLVRKEHDLWMKKRKQKECRAPGTRERMTKWLGRHHETYQNGQTGKRREWEDSEWRLELEGKAEVSEIIIVSDAVEGTPVDLDGESRYEQVEAKFWRGGREMLNGEEIRESPKRK